MTITDFKLPRCEWSRNSEKASEKPATPSLILITAHGTSETGIEATNSTPMITYSNLSIVSAQETGAERG